MVIVQPVDASEHYEDARGFSRVDGVLRLQSYDCQGGSIRSCKASEVLRFVGVHFTGCGGSHRVFSPLRS